MPALLQNQGNYRHNDGSGVEQDCEPFVEAHMAPFLEADVRKEIL